MEQTAAEAALVAVDGGVPSLGLVAAGDTETMSREELRMELNVAREAAAGALEELRKVARLLSLQEAQNEDFRQEMDEVRAGEGGRWREQRGDVGRSSKHELERRRQPTQRI